MSSVLVLPGDNGGCGFYRLRAPAEACATVGGKDVVVDDVPLTYVAEPQADGTMRVVHVDMSTLPDVDTVVVQRPLGDTGWQFIRHLRAAGFRVVVDVDDDFDRLHPSNPAARQCATDPRFAARNVHRAIGEADACTVSTPALAARYGVNGTPTVVVRNMVPAWYLEVVAVRVVRSVGWAGTTVTHVGDLGVLGGALGVLQRDGWGVRVVGVASREALGCEGEPLVTGWQPLDRYPYEVASFGVGVVPLRDTQFNRGKSWLKGLEYAALGVPFVASPSPEYEVLAGLGLGRTADRPRRWVREIRAAAGLLPGGLRGRVRAAGLTVEDRWEAWWQVWATP